MLSQACCETLVALTWWPLSLCENWGISGPGPGWPRTEPASGRLPQHQVSRRCGAPEGRGSGYTGKKMKTIWTMKYWFQKGLLSNILCQYQLQHVKVSIITTSYSRPAMRLPLTAFLHTSPMPPAWLAPTTMTAVWPANITTVWNTSVQITAFRPPWNIGVRDLFSVPSYSTLKHIYKLCMDPPSHTDNRSNE